MTEKLPRRLLRVVGWSPFPLRHEKRVHARAVAEAKKTVAAIYPREGWVVLVDKEGREVGSRVPVVVKCDPLDFKISHTLLFTQHTATTAYAVRVIDADGVVRDVPLVDALRP